MTEALLIKRERKERCRDRHIAIQPLRIVSDHHYWEARAEAKREAA